MLDQRRKRWSWPSFMLYWATSLKVVLYHRTKGSKSKCLCLSIRIDFSMTVLIFNNDKWSFGCLFQSLFSHQQKNTPHIYCLFPLMFLQTCRQKALAKKKKLRTSSQTAYSPSSLIAQSLEPLSVSLPHRWNLSVSLFHHCNSRDPCRMV